MSHPAEYTVGWICTNVTELVAAQTLLDDQHNSPEYVSPNDNNSYSLGTMGRHRVVIAALPDGECGISTAAHVARDMLHTFRNIRFGLLVGIGGGAPSLKHDIRLGDVVVSSSREGKGSVFQYDFGESVQSQEFRATSYLNQPPAILRTAISGLRAQHQSDGNKIEEMINHALEKKPRLRKAYSRPDPSTDKLYRHDIIHQAEMDDCSVGCSQDPSHFISRLCRTEYDDDPVVHYGTIASANQLMKDALTRDKLAAENHVLCFEREAAGLMNNFPCLVIRGICDYADTHRNEKWQGYASMTAAAYAKALLSCIHPSKVEAEKKMATLVSNAIELISNVQHEVGIMKAIAHNHEELEILQWLTTTDFCPEQNDNLNRREPGTGQDLLQSTAFQEWIGNSDHTLLCHGIPGAGKTIQTAIVIDHLFQTFHSHHDVGLAYIYFNFRRKGDQSLSNLLASLLKQLSKGRPLSDQLRSLYKRHASHDIRPSEKELSEITNVISGRYSRVFIIIDALDECPESDGLRLKFLEELRHLQASSKANIFLTSRFLPEVLKEFRNVTVEEVKASDSDIGKYLNGQLARLPSFVHRSPELKDQVEQGVLKAVKGMWLLARLHIDSLVGKRSIKAIKDALNSLPSGSKAYDLAYENAMERINGQVHGQSELANQALLWITCAKTALTTPQFLHALAVEVGTRSFEPENMSEVEDIVTACAGLVAFDKQSDVIRLVHYTTQDYLERTQTRWFPNAHAELTKTCVTYLSFRHFEISLLNSRHKLDERNRLYPFYRYAVYYWGTHAHETRAMLSEVAAFLKSERAVKSAGQIMSMKMHPRHNWTRMTMTGLHFAAISGALEVAEWLITILNADIDALDSQDNTPLVKATQFGHEDVVRLLLNHGANSNPLGSTVTPLLEAVRSESLSIVQALVQYGADFNLLGSNTTSWLEALQCGNPRIIELLVQHVVKINPPTITTSLLLEAIQNKHSTVAELLKKHGANTNPTSDHSPLLEAICNKEPALAECLIQYGANLNPKVERSPLLVALQNKYSTLAALLVQQGANVNFSTLTTSPLLEAIHNRDLTLAELMVQRGADVRFSTPTTSPLLEAIRNGYLAIAELLIQRGADVNFSTSTTSPLLEATRNGYLAIVELLMQRQADAQKNQRGSSALSEAVDHGHVNIVKAMIRNGDHLHHFLQNHRSTARATFRGNPAMANLLIGYMIRHPAKDRDKYGFDHHLFDKGPRTTTTSYGIRGDDTSTPPGSLVKLIYNNYNGTSLLNAALCGNKVTIKRLLANGFDINSRLGRTNKTPLVMAAGEIGSEIAVHSLVEHGADIELGNGNSHGISPLLATIIYNNVECARILLDKGAEINPTFQIPLHLAVICGRYEIAKLLLEKGADVNLYDSSQRTALSLVCEFSNEDLLWHRNPFSSDISRDSEIQAADEIIKLLLSKGADIEAQDIYRQSPLFIACASGQRWAVKVLLESGALLYVRDENGETPGDVAIRKGLDTIVELLVDHEYLRRVPLSNVWRNRTDSRSKT